MVTQRCQDDKGSADLRLHGTERVPHTSRQLKILASRYASVQRRSGTEDSES